METTYGSLDDFPLSPPSTPTQELSSTTTTAADVQNPRKKRTMLLHVHTHEAGAIFSPSAPSSSHGHHQSPNKSKTKKPDPAAPKITRPCSECGKKFWSWKALFGHMRCHPERQWRGINPPPQFMRLPELAISGTPDYQRPAAPAAASFHASMTEVDHEIAACLLLLATGSTGSNSVSATAGELARQVIGTPKQGDVAEDYGQYPDDHHANVGGSEVGIGAGPPSSSGCRFECSSCKKAFGSHQALGGHRASHKNVKGCFAITRDEMVVAEEEEEGVGGENMMVVLGGHRCGICLRVFPTGKGLSGHKRCHLERTDEEGMLGGIPRGGDGGCVLDLNLPAPLEELQAAGCPSCRSPVLHLELKLGI